MISWSDIVFAFRTWLVNRQMDKDDRAGTGPLSGRAWRKQLRGEPLTAEEQMALHEAEHFLEKIRTPKTDNHYRKVIDASSSQIRQEYTNESAQLKPASTPAYEKWIQALGEGDYATALKALRASANDGNLSAMHWLGAMYHEGKGVSVNHHEAAQWLLKAAEGGHAASQFVLGSMYQAGTGVARNLHETIRWWRKAAEQGDSMAQYNLGLMYAQGEGVREDPLEARQWVEKAAEQRETRTYFNLGLLYLAEPKDFVRAYMWLTRSIMEHENETQAEESRTRLRTVMTPEQIAEAEQLAHRWPPNVITWKWATGKQQPTESHPIERPAIRTLMQSAHPSIWIKGLRWGQLIVILIVALAAGFTGYLYKQSTIFEYGDMWTGISGPLNLGPPTEHPPEGVILTAAHTKSLPKGTLIVFQNAMTSVKFATALFNRDWDADLLYRFSLDSEAHKVISVEEHQATQCDFHLTFRLYDKDGIFLVGLIGPHDTFTVGRQEQFQGSVDEEIPAQMARRTTRIERDVIIHECHP